MWRRSRRIEVQATCALWIMAMWGKVDQKRVMRSFPGYEPDSED